MMTDLIIVNYASFEGTMNAIRSARHHLSAALGDVLVVENGTGEEDAFRKKRIEVLAFAENRGFAAGVNAGVGCLMERSRFRRPVMVLNPDAYLLDGAWVSFVTWVVGHVGVAAPRVLSPNGDVQASVYGAPTEHGPWMEALGVQRWARALGYGRKMPEDRTEVDAVQGSCFIVSPRAWKEVGPFDERFFLYHEEVDWCLRARDLGFVNIYDPMVSIMHEGGVDVPPGREERYFRGVADLVEKRRGLAAAARLRSRIRLAARVGSWLASDPDRREGLRAVAGA